MGYFPGDTEISTSSDERLVVEALDDSHPAFEQLVEKYQYPVMRTIASIIKDEEAAQDVAQETFLSAWSNLPKLKEKQKFGRWLNRTAINLARALVEGAAEVSGGHRFAHRERRPLDTGSEKRG